MDHASPYLSESLLVLRTAGIRHVLKCESPAPRDPLSAEPWQRVLARVPATASIVWTYAELGNDLLGAPNKQRGQLWRRVIAALRLPSGTVGFVPFALPAGQTTQIDFHGFTQALNRIGPGLVVAFIAASETSLCLQLESSVASMDQPSRLCITSSPDALLTMHEDAFEAFVRDLSRHSLQGDRSA